MFKSFSRTGAALVLAAFLSACQSADPARILSPGGEQAGIDPTTAAPVVQGKCPKVYLREGTAYFRTYTKNGEGDPEQIIHQAMIADTTRQCRLSGSDLRMTVQASGRVVAGPAGGPGTVTLPVRVAVVQDDVVQYSQLQKIEVTLPQGAATTQFLVTDSEVTLPASAAGASRVWIGFDPGPYDTP
ncbi:hypothetical protein [Pseudohoeflea coraliihabitans]|uniref:Lipoprotein n=1 Tax=Pseudohoeflea coraliihabitans TaxID=2860393 RepID=A0ABS6WMA7_9HYPH|nr:hypothetical protein [Pseudohoeflea sp. DP4N28-3]MBW3096920.1 hypothetical protein [Pseudohoeflea sp. DP4N28-3]